MKLSSLEFTQRFGVAQQSVLFPDTCALLDIVRLPIRKSARVVRGELVAIHAIINAVQSQNSAISILLPEQVKREWDENIAGVEAEVERKVTQWASQADQFASALCHFGRAAIPAKMDVACRHVIADLRKLTTEIFARSIVINDDDACMVNAMQRVLCGRAPAQKGAQGKDCVIIEHVLAAMQIIRVGSARGCVFLSSNTEDYRQAQPSTLLRPPLDNEFAATDLTFCTDWNWAKRALAV
ncbi:MAG: hypothetical protein QM784_30545 [Polyangiaceae bacterium]